MKEMSAPTPSQGEISNCREPISPSDHVFPGSQLPLLPRTYSVYCLTNALVVDCSGVHIVAMNCAFDRQQLPDPMGWFSMLGPELLDELLSRCSELNVEAGQTIYRTDDPAGGIYTVLHGRIDYHWAHLPSGSPIFYATGPGWWVGDLAAISGRPRRFDLLAGRNSKVLRLNRTVFIDLLENHSEVYRAVLTMVTSTMDGAIDVMRFLSMDDPTTRMAACLLALNSTGRGWDGVLPLSQGEIASIARISRRRTNSALANLEAEGMINRGYGLISIRDESKLRCKCGL